jgi:hypothetical protein
MYSVEALPLRAGSRAWLVLNNDETVFRTSSGDIGRVTLREAIQQHLARERVVAASAAFRGGIRVLLYRPEAVTEDARSEGPGAMATTDASIVASATPNPQDNTVAARRAHWTR